MRSAHVRLVQVELVEGLARGAEIDIMDREHSMHLH